MNAPLKFRFARLPALLRDVGPFAAIELLLPGGSLIALLFWLLRRRASNPVTHVTPIRELRAGTIS